MTTLKHTFGFLNSTNDPMIGAFAEVSNATNTGLAIGLLIFVFVITTYIGIRKTQDTTKATLIAGHFVFLTSILLYYAGKVSGFIFIYDLFFYGIAVIYSLGLVYTTWMRMKED